MGRQNSQKQKAFQLKSLLMKDWKEKCGVYFHDSQPPIIKSQCRTFNTSACFKFGVCTCGKSPGSCPDAGSFSQNLTRHMKRQFWKKQKQPSKLRVLLEQKRCIVLAFSKGSRQGEEFLFDEPSHFAFIGHINFSNWHFAVLNMFPKEKDDDVWLLEADSRDSLGVNHPAGELHTDLQYFRDVLDLAQPWKVTICKISDRSIHWPTPPPAPELIPVVVLGEEDEAEPFICWRGSGAEGAARQEQQKEQNDSKRRKRKGTDMVGDKDGLEAALCLLPAPPAGKKSRNKPQKQEPSQPANMAFESDQEDFTAFDDVYDLPVSEPSDGLEDAQSDDQQLEPVPGNTGFSDSDSSMYPSPSPADCSESDKEPDAPDIQLEGDAVERLLNLVHDAGGVSVDDSVVPSSSSTAAAAVVSEAISEMRCSDGAAAAVAVPAGEPALDPTPGQEASAAPNAGSVRASGPRDRASTHTLQVGSHGEIRYIPSSKQLVAVCNHPLHQDCRRTRSALEANSLNTPLQKGQGRPLCLLTQWLRVSTNWDSQREHCHKFGTSYDERVAARTYLMSLSNAPEFANQFERPKRDHESDEPASIR